MKAKLFYLHAAAAGFVYLLGLSPLSAHGYSVCYSGAYLNCVGAGGSPGNCSRQAEAICRNHGHGGGGIQKPDFGFKSESRTSYGKSRPSAVKLNHHRRSQ